VGAVVVVVVVVAVVVVAGVTMTELQLQLAVALRHWIFGLRAMDRRLAFKLLYYSRIEFETIVSLDDSTDWKDRSCPRLAGVLTEVGKWASSSSSSVGTGEVVDALQ
jgi:hypothetical protein